MQSYYVELPGLSTDQFIEFSRYMIESRTTQIEEDGVEFESFKQLDIGEEFPNILFITRLPETKPNWKYQPLFPPPLPRLHARDIINGQIVEPVFNLESKLETYYNIGIQDGNLQYLHEFSKIFMFVISNCMYISTELINGTRKFKVVNTNFFNPNYYIIS